MRVTDRARKWSPYGRANKRRWRKKLQESQATMLFLLALKVLKHIGTDTPVIDEHNTVRKFRLARVGDIALLEKSADDQSHNSMPRVFVDNDYYFLIFQVQPDNASRRCRRCGSIVSL
jgi:hypothetical protein